MQHSNNLVFIKMEVGFLAMSSTLLFEDFCLKCGAAVGIDRHKLSDTNMIMQTCLLSSKWLLEENNIVTMAIILVPDYTHTQIFLRMHSFSMFRSLSRKK